MERQKMVRWRLGPCSAVRFYTNPLTSQDRVTEVEFINAGNISPANKELLTSYFIGYTKEELIWLNEDLQRQYIAAGCPHPGFLHYRIQGALAYAKAYTRANFTINSADLLTILQEVE